MYKSISIKCIILILLFICFGSLIKAQKVAVVLSGGGAKGFTHIGVLKALEEHNIPIDYITGTSMGAIVGGLYVSGYSPEEIENLMLSSEFKRWATGIINPKYTYYYKKTDPNASWISLPFRYDNKFISKLPFQLIPTDEMDFNFLEVFAGPSAACNYNFDNLLIPFRCIAADIEESKEVILKDGQLGDAVRASMAVPFFFAPIRIGGKLLFDGGIYNNFPVDVAFRDFKPDFIIGSKAAKNFKPPEEDDILSQLQNMLTSKTDYGYIPGKSVLIEPKLGSLNITDFSKAEEYIDSGYVNTLKKIELIESMIDRRSNPDILFKKRLSFFNKRPPVIIDSVHVFGLNELQKDYVIEHIKRDNYYLTIPEFKKEYFKLIEDKQISSIYPRLVYDGSKGFYDAELSVKKSDPFLLEFGGNISSSAVNEAFLGFNYNYLGKKASSYSALVQFGKFYNGVNLNAKIEFSAKTSNYLKLAYVLNDRDYFHNTTYFVDDKTPSFLKQRESYYQLDWGWPIKNHAKIVVSINDGKLNDDYYQINEFTRYDTTDRTDFNFYSPSLKYEFNTLNKKQYPTSGKRFYVASRYVHGDEEHFPGTTSPQTLLYDFTHDYLQLHLMYERYFNMGRFSKLGIHSELYVSNKKFFNNYTSTILFAQQFQPIPESQTLFLPNYRGYNYVAIGIKAIVPIQKIIEWRSEVYYFQPFKQIHNNYEDKLPYYGTFFSNRSFIISTALIGDTPLGPISFSLNYYDRHKNPFSFVFNFGYIIFNKTALD